MSKRPGRLRLFGERAESPMTPGATFMKNRTISSIGRSSAAVLAGLVTIGVLSHATDALLRAIGTFPAFGTPMSEPAFALAFTYRCLFSVLGCYLTARLAMRAPTLHAFVLGGIGFVISATAAIVCWDRGPEFGPHWYPLLLVASAFPAAWLGAAWFTRSRAHAPSQIAACNS